MDNYYKDYSALYCDIDNIKFCSLIEILNYVTKLQENTLYVSQVKSKKEIVITNTPIIKQILKQIESRKFISLENIAMNYYNPLYVNVYDLEFIIFKDDINIVIKFEVDDKHYDKVLYSALRDKDNLMKFCNCKFDLVLSKNNIFMREVNPKCFDLEAITTVIEFLTKSKIISEEKAKEVLKKAKFECL